MKGRESLNFVPRSEVEVADGLVRRVASVTSAGDVTSSRKKHGSPQSNGLFLSSEEGDSTPPRRTVDLPARRFRLICRLIKRTSPSADPPAGASGVTPRHFPVEPVRQPNRSRSGVPGGWSVHPLDGLGTRWTLGRGD